MKTLAIYILAHAIPFIFADGEHDDTAGIEALVCHEYFGYREGALSITYDATGRQTIKAGAGAVLVLPLGWPRVKGSNLELAFPTGSVVSTYEHECDTKGESS